MVVFEARTSTAAQLFGNGVNDQALLVGLSTSGQRAFTMAAVGYGRAQVTHSCDGPCGPGPSGPYGPAFPYELMAEANLSAIGVGLTLFGTVGSGLAKYTAIAVSVQAGWLGGW